MSRILLADDSPHAQRMGERILREEGFEVVSLTDGETALLRLGDADPDVILADVFLPGKSGFDICRYVKSHPKHRHVRVIVTAGLLERFDEEEAKRAGCDGILKKPFEASLLLRTIKPLVSEAKLSRTLFAEQSAPEAAEQPKIAAVPPTPQPARMVETPEKAEPAAAPAPQPVRMADKPEKAEPAAAPAPQPTPGATVQIKAPPEPEPDVETAKSERKTELDPERIRAAVTLALDAAMPALVDEITERVLIALGQ